LNLIARSIDEVLQTQRKARGLLNVHNILKHIKEALYYTGNTEHTIPGKYFVLLYQQVKRAEKMNEHPRPDDPAPQAAALTALQGIRNETIPTIEQLLNQSVKENFADGEVKESKETRQALLDQHFKFPQQGQYGYRTGYQGRGVLEVADGRTGKIINLGEFGTFDGDREPNQKWLRIVFTNPNMDDNAWDELEDMLWSDDQVAENFADGKNPQDKGDSARHGIPKGATMAQLEKAAKASGRKGQLARWQINMRRGKKK
jgi:hypothetical protein